jgi:UDP-N-acetylmuramyl pentapeptide synthase
MKNHETLNDTFDITPTEVVAKPIKRNKETVALTNVSEMKDKDVAYVRGKLYEMTEKLSEAANESLESALESGHPRAWEVAGNTMKLAADTAEKLIHLQGSNRRLDEERPVVNATQNNTSVTNNVMFSGSTQEMMAMLKEAQRENNK